MGIFSAIGTALKNPDVQDRLAAIGSTLQGDTHAAQGYMQRSAQRLAAEDTAAKLEAMAQAQSEALAAQNMAPPTPFEPTALPIDGPVRLPAPVAPITVRELPQLAAAAQAPAAPMVSAPASPMPAAAAPSAPVPRSIYAEMLPQLIRASGRGADVSGLASMLQQEDYIRSLPQKDQATARAAGVANFANWQRDANKPVYNETTPGNTWGRFDPATGEYKPIYTAPARPEPVTTERVIGSIIAKRAQGIDLTPAEQAVYDRWENGAPKEDKQPGTSQIVGAVLAKVQQGGIESLTPGEKLIWDRYNRAPASPFGFPMGGDDDEEGAAPAAPAAPAARQLPQKPAQRQPVRSKTAPVPGATKGADGFWYVKQGSQWFRVDQ